MKLINKVLLDEVSRQAKESPRLRMNYNFHHFPQAGAQRLLNALEPGTGLAVHRHRDTDETYLLLRGKLKIVFYNDRKEITETALLDTSLQQYGVHIPAGQWHTVEVLEPDTVIFEVKDGPYIPLEPGNILT